MKGRGWGAGAGDSPTGYDVEKIGNDNNKAQDIITSLDHFRHITSGLLPVLFLYRKLCIRQSLYLGKVFSAANMAGFMGVDSMRDDIAADLEWLYDNGLTWTKPTQDGTNIKVSAIQTVSQIGSEYKLHRLCVKIQETM